MGTRLVFSREYKLEAVKLVTECVVLVGGDLAQGVGAREELAGGVVGVGGQLAGGVAHGQRAVLVVPGDLGQRLLAAGGDLGDARQVDAVGGVGVPGLAPDRVHGAGDLTPGVVVVALQLGAAVDAVADVGPAPGMARSKTATSTNGTPPCGRR